MGNSNGLEARLKKLERILRALRRLTVELTLLAAAVVGLVYVVVSHWPG